MRLYSPQDLGYHLAPKCHDCKVACPVYAKKSTYLWLKGEFGAWSNDEKKGIAWKPFINHSPIGI